MAVIGTNLAASSAVFYLNQNNAGLTKTIKELSSGSRLSDPSADAAGVAVSGNLVARIGRLGAASNSVKDVVSMAQTVDGFLSTIQTELTRMSELAQESTNGAFGTADLANYNTEFVKLATQIGNIASNATFDGQTLFTAGSVTVGINSDNVTDSFSLSTIGSLSSLALTTSSIGDTVSASTALSAVGSAITCITTQRAKVNADVSKFNFYVTNIETEKNNLTAANSNVSDLDMAAQSTNLSKYNILVQAATASLAQANSSQQAVLSLLH